MLTPLRPSLALLLSLLMFTALGLAAPATACPGCDPGKLARAQVLNDNFLVNLLIALAPFAVMTGVSLWANRVGRPLPQRGTET